MTDWNKKDVEELCDLIMNSDSIIKELKSLEESK